MVALADEGYHLAIYRILVLTAPVAYLIPAPIYLGVHPGHLYLNHAVALLQMKPQPNPDSKGSTYLVW